jgi:hypothetical protein
MEPIQLAGLVGRINSDEDAKGSSSDFEQMLLLLRRSDQVTRLLVSKSSSIVSVRFFFS